MNEEKKKKHVTITISIPLIVCVDNSDMSEAEIKKVISYQDPVFFKDMIRDQIYEASVVYVEDCECD